MGRYIKGIALDDRTLGEVLKDVNMRVSSFMSSERVQAGRSIRTVARKLKIRRRHIKAWEEGRKSPPIREMMRVTAMYGKKSNERCKELVYKVLNEKTERDRQRLAIAANPPKKLPAVIWAESKAA